MDIPRPSRKKEKLRRRVLIGIAVVAALALVTVALNSLEPAAREVDRASVWFGTVERGGMLRSVSGHGTLVPQQIRWIAAEQEGLVEQVHIEAGAQVEAETVILELSNPELRQEVEEAELQLLAVEAEYHDLEVRLESQLLDQEANLARVKADQEGAALEAEANQELFDADVISAIVLRRSQLQAEQTTVRYEIEQQRVAKTTDSHQAKLEVKRSEIDQRRRLYQLRERQLESLRVRAGISGVLQEVMVDPGQRVTPGSSLARVADPRTLKAELRVNETQAKDVALGLVATVDTRNGVVEGRVTRIDPAVQQGTVLVDVALVGDLPAGARPDLSVDGEIEIERLDDVLFVKRPTHAQADQKIGLFRLEPDGTTASRISVSLGKMSVSTVEVLQGLSIGDEVILSDTSAFDDVDRIRLN